jgi:hypothetical protein
VPLGLAVVRHVVVGLMPRPIRTTESNFTFLGPSSNVADLPGQREAGRRFYSVWKLSDEEREAIAKGGNLELGIYCDPIPPVSIVVTDVPEVAVDHNGKRDFRCANDDCRALYVEHRANQLDHKCGQCGGELRAAEVV